MLIGESTNRAILVMQRYLGRYLQLLFLGKPAHSLPGRCLPHEGHDPDEGEVAAQHGGDLLHTLPEGGEDHHTSAGTLGPAF